MKTNKNSKYMLKQEINSQFKKGKITPKEANENMSVLHELQEKSDQLVEELTFQKSSMNFKINCKCGSSIYNGIERSTNKKVEILLGKSEENGEDYEYSICYIPDREFIDSSKNMELELLNSLFLSRYRKIIKIRDFVVL